jgi:ribosomal protein L7/L12
VQSHSFQQKQKQGKRQNICLATERDKKVEVIKRWSE